MPSPSVKRLLLLETPWTPRRLPTLQAWYKSNRLPLADAVAVTSMADQSPNANTLSQGTGANQFTFVANGQNSKGVIRSDGGDFMTAADSASLDAITGNVGVFAVVVTPASFAGSPGLMTKGLSGARGAFALYVSTTGLINAQIRGNLVDRTVAASGMAPLSVSTAYALGFTWAPETHRFYVAGTLVDTQANADSNTSMKTDGAGLIVGGLTAAGGNNWTGDIAELVIVGSAATTPMDAADRGKLFSYFLREWGV